MKIKKHIKVKGFALVTISAFVIGGMVGQATPTPQETAFNKQVTRLENENNRIFSDYNDTKVLPGDYQKQEFNAIDKVIQKENFSHRQTVILNSMVNSNINDYQDTWYMTH